MGGSNSGSNQRRSRYGRVDGTWPLDVMALHRAGWLKPGKWGTYRPNLNLLAKEGQLTIIYKTTFEDGSQRPIGETFDIVYSRRHFGGEVPYLVCLGNGCRRRVSKLYRSSGRYRCRKCSKLVYDCQYESSVDRAVRRINKINGKLGTAESYSARPKYMRRRTYDKLLRQLQSIEDRCGI